MISTAPTRPVVPGSDIRIVGLNTDKTRKMIGSDSVYQVYLELSGSPTVIWRSFFDAEWKKTNAQQPLALHDASVERTFLIIHCALEELADYLPKLRQAVSASNTDFLQFMETQASEQQSRIDVWKTERARVEQVARSLDFT